MRLGILDCDRLDPEFEARFGRVYSGMFIEDSGPWHRIWNFGSGRPWMATCRWIWMSAMPGSSRDRAMTPMGMPLGGSIAGVGAPGG